MTSDDVCILTPILLAALGASIVVHRTFRSTATTRDAVITPPIFAVIGGLGGLSIGMICLSDADGRVVIDKGVPILLCGIVIGAVAGVGVRCVYSKLRRGKAVVFVLVMTLLGASIGAPIGWITESFGPRTFYDAQLSVSRMLWGVVIGSGIGFFMGLPELLSRPSVAT